jgi:hypothetical protein
MPPDRTRPRREASSIAQQPDMSTPEITFGEPRAFKIAIPEDDLQRVKSFVELSKPNLDRLAAFELAQQPEDVAEYGLSSSKLLPIIERLRSGYDWRKEEAAMNDLGDHYKVKLSNVPDQGDLEMHVVVRKSGKAGAIPLLLAHGWPGSCVAARVQRDKG